MAGGSNARLAVSDAGCAARPGLLRGVGTLLCINTAAGGLRHLRSGRGAGNCGAGPACTHHGACQSRLPVAFNSPNPRGFAVAATHACVDMKFDLAF